MANANDTVSAKSSDQLAAETAIRAQAARVTEMRFGKKIKLCKRNGFGSRPSGWHLLVEGPVGGFIMAADDGFLYRINDDAADPMYNDRVVFTDVVDAIAMAEALEANLDEDQLVIDPRRAFISKFLNPKSFEKQVAYWTSEDSAVGPVLCR